MSLVNHVISDLHLKGACTSGFVSGSNEWHCNVWVSQFPGLLGCPSSCNLGWPFPPSASASLFYRCFCPQRVFPWESLHETLINTVFCVQLSQNEFPHAYALLLQPASATKLTFETIWKMSNFRISFFEKKKVASQRSGENHCCNFRSSGPQPPCSVNGFPTAHFQQKEAVSSPQNSAAIF